MHVPSKAAFRERARAGKRIPVYRDILADFETPLSAYWKLAQNEVHSFLLESVTGGEQLARYSILGVRPRLVLRSKGSKLKRITAAREEHEELSADQDPLDVLNIELARLEADNVEGLPKFFGGAVGMLGYDLVRFFERLPDGTEDDLEVDDMAMMLCDSVVVFDHAKNLVRMIVLAEPTDEGYERALSEIERLMGCLRGPLPDVPRSKSSFKQVTSNMDQVRFEEIVARVREYIAAGDGIQMVLSQRFCTEVDAHPLTVYRALRSLNPSPYMFLLRFGNFDVVGASPEILVSLNGRQAQVRPIAGTRPRGSTTAQDQALAEELLADEKERAEHIMLVDLGRNDLGRVCEYGSITVNELMVIERYSHVMHIVSDVTGVLRAEVGAMGLVRATFPAGTVSGAPKVRAMEIIDELEPTKRGCYAGAIGYIGANGDMDLCIAIRTIYIQGGKAYIQAGAGLVYDSVPTNEFVETRNKAQAALKAIQMAQEGLGA